MSRRSTSGQSDFKLDNTRDRNVIRKDRSDPRHMKPKELIHPEGEYFCREHECRAVFYSKSWHNDERRYKVLSQDDSLARTCPACRKVALDMPEGIVTLSALGALPREKVQELYNIVRNIGDRARKRDPMARVMRINDKGDEAVIYTTENQLAIAIGNEIKRAFGGDLNVDYSHRDNDIARVVWIAKQAGGRLKGQRLVS